MRSVRDRPLRVAVDASPLLGERSGVGQTTARLLTGLGARSDLAVTGYAVSRRGRDDLVGSVPPGVRVGTSWLPARFAHRCWQWTAWPRIEHWTGAVDVVHATNFAAPPASAPVVVTVHDLAFAHSPELCRPETRTYDPLLRRTLNDGATVHAVSDHVAGEMRAHYGLDADRVVRVYYGVDTAGGGDPARGRALAGHDRYVLAIGTIEPRKNYPALVRAFTAVAARDRELGLVIAGGRGWGVTPFDEAVDGSGVAARIRALGYVSGAERADLLAGATVLAYPSLYEGFGHPPFEAMAVGVPVVATSAGAVPEAVGDAALLVDPRDDDELAGALARAVSDEPLRAQLVARGHARVTAFPWDRAVDELVALYRRAAGAG